MPDLHIKRPYFSAWKFFRWKDKSWGYGISTDKLDKLKKDGKKYITIQLEGSDVYEVELARLETCITNRNSYNQNGKAHCGYVTKSDILRLARLLKQARTDSSDEDQPSPSGTAEIATSEGTNIAEG